MDLNPNPYNFQTCKNFPNLQFLQFGHCSSLQCYSIVCIFCTTIAAVTQLKSIIRTPLVQCCNYYQFSILYVNYDLISLTFYRDKLTRNQLKACRGQIDKYEVKLEVRYSQRLPRCTFIKNFRLLSLKLTELQLF